MAEHFPLPSSTGGRRSGLGRKGEVATCHFPPRFSLFLRFIFTVVCLADAHFYSRPMRLALIFSDLSPCIPARATCCRLPRPGV